jgi:hypothetical protein
MEQVKKTKKCFMLRRNTAPKLDKTSICNAQSNEPGSPSAKSMSPPQACMSKLIKVAKEALKKARLEKEAKLLKEITKMEEANLLEEETRKDKQIVPPPVEDFETFAKRLVTCH